MKNPWLDKKEKQLKEAREFWKECSRWADYIPRKNILTKYGKKAWKSEK